MSVRVLVTVLSSDGLHAQMNKAIRRTWGQDARDDFAILYHYGRTSFLPQVQDGEVVRIGDVLACGVSDKWECCLPKRLLAFDYARRNCEYDYVYSVCDGSYVDRDNLLAWVEGKPRERFYAGVNGPYNGSEWRYASGSGFFLSPDLVNLLADNMREVLGWNPSLHHFDDVCIGHFLASRGVVVSDAPRIDDEPRYEAGNFHWHFRTYPEKFDQTRICIAEDR
jgi:hypothetical protein